MSLLLAAVLAGAGAVHCYQPAGLSNIYSDRGFGGIPHPVRGAVRIMAAILLAIPAVRIWGGLLAAFILFFSVVRHLRNAHYSWAISGMIAMIMVPATMLPPTFS